MSRIIIALFAASMAIAAVSANCVDKSGNKHKAGDEWTEKGTKSSTFDFTMRCTESNQEQQKSGTTTGANGTTTIVKNAWNVEVVGCVVPNSGEKLEVGQTATNDNKEWKCDKDANGMVTMHMQPKKGASSGTQKAQKDGATSSDNTAANNQHQQQQSQSDSNGANAGAQNNQKQQDQQQKPKDQGSEQKNQ